MRGDSIGFIGSEPFRHRVLAFRAAFPDLALDTELIFAVGDLVAVLSREHSERHLGLTRTDDLRYRHPMMGRRATSVAGIVGLLLAACTTGSPGASPQDSISQAMSDMPATTVAEPSPSASEDPLAVCEGVEPEGEPLEIAVGTASYAFDPRTIEGPRHCQPFVIVFTNSDPPMAGVNQAGTNEHNVTIRAENLIGALLFDGEVIGRDTIRYEVPGLPAGEHYMYCKAHPSMTSRLMVTAAGG